MRDVFGKALADFQSGNYTEDLITWTSISCKDRLPIPYLFRDFNEMPQLEQKAMQLCTGSILDVGCGAGSHSLWLQEQGYKVKAIDVSKRAIEVCKKRGVKNCEALSLIEETESFDTILLLMNGTGIFQNMAKLPIYLKHLKSLLKSGGQILIDSSDIAYMYNEDINLLKKSKRYYGELDYFLSYKEEEEQHITWLYLDFKTLQNACLNEGLVCENILSGKHHDYLASLTINQ